MIDFLTMVTCGRQTDLPGGRLARGPIAGESAAPPVSVRPGAQPANPRAPFLSRRRLCGDSPTVALETIFGRAFDRRQIQPMTKVGGGNGPWSSAASLVPSRTWKYGAGAATAFRS